MRNERKAPGDKIRHNNFGTRGRESLIINQDWQARSLGPHPLVNILPQTATEPIVTVLNVPTHTLVRNRSPILSTAFFRPPFLWVLGSRCHASERKTARAGGKVTALFSDYLI